MRFTKIPLIATLMAVALSLLIVLPGLAQTSDFDDPRGDALQRLRPHRRCDGRRDVAAESYFDGDLYVSNDDEAHDTVIDHGAEPATLISTVFPGALTAGSCQIDLAVRQPTRTMQVTPRHR